MTTYGKFDSDAFYERLLTFGQKGQNLAKILPKTQYNFEYGKQLIRSSASPGANYIEAIEALSRKDFVHRLRICRKEIREAIHWLRLIQGANSYLKDIAAASASLTKEGRELIRILTASILTSERKNS